MYAQEPETVFCPYCGESIELLIDTSCERQEYIEDCSVCCRPISVSVEVSASGAVAVQVRDENSC